MNRNSAGIAAAGVALLIGVGVVTFGGSRLATAQQREISIGGSVQAAQAPALQQYVVKRRPAPNRTEVLTKQGQLVAVMTDGTRTAHLQGPRRTFAEARFTSAKIITTEYVRLAPRSWTPAAVNEPWFATWLTKAVADRSPDILAIAFEYTYGAAPKKDKNGRQYSGDASFGPLSDIDPDGRAENSDFYDYLGSRWEFVDGKDEKPSATHILSLDCSGFLRMVYGYRSGYPLLGGNDKGPGLPRRALAMAANGPGVQLMPNTGKRATDIDRLMPGDILLFNAGPVQNKHIEHSGMYLGIDDQGHRRFISSRSQANGPTMGDLHGESILDGSGYWATRLRTARRI
ncbi:NlpC/P60 family protein [Paractinoplanes hotanensis]|uniref:C40 family peptidase n=1 Tax=Paractinoplanes hotanensis TaxID=2906497 RepID=A0ABT0Y228_9ACTN|nr:NlpC/P60 family protein [Actinoplanes hotanensis]MCM4079414.1 C40 family peptidase [Actinoplanes hotanensis]